MHFHIILVHFTAAGPSQSGKGSSCSVTKAAWKPAPRRRRSDAGCRTGLSDRVPLQRACSSLAHTDLLKSLTVGKWQRVGPTGLTRCKLNAHQARGLFGEKTIRQRAEGSKSREDLQRHRESRSGSGPRCCCCCYWSKVLSTSTNPSCPDVDLWRQEKRFYVKQFRGTV